MATDLLPSEVLTRAKARIATPERWTKGTYARDESGEPADSYSARAVCWCMLGAVFADVIDGIAIEHAICLPHPIEDALKAANGGEVRFAHFNDAPETTHADVLAVLDRAIAFAKRREAEVSR